LNQADSVLAALEIHAIARIISARILDASSDATTITRLLYDSRKLTIAAGTLFVAIPGQHKDGHDHIPDLYRLGVRNFLVSKEVRLPGPANVLLVGDSLLALQQLAADHRAHFRGKVVGITGSNGKTVVKEWLFQSLHEISAIGRSPRSYNSQLGVALSLLQIEPYHEIALIEAGISKPGEMDRLETMIQPDIGVFTALGPAHDEHFLSREEKLKEKLLLFRHARAVVYPADNEFIAASMRSALGPETRHVSWGRKGNTIRVTSMESRARGTLLHAIIGKHTLALDLPYRDDASLENVLTVATLLLLLGREASELPELLGRLQPIEMRMEIKEGVNGCTLINDSYSTDLMSLEIALDQLMQQQDERERQVILSDILQTGKPGETLYAEVGGMLSARGIQHVVAIGEEITRFGKLLPKGTMYFPDTLSFLGQLRISDFRNRLILLKGARSFGFERIAARLQRKAHETVLQINMNALVHNLRYYQSLLSPGTRTMAMVKAFGYGSGMQEVALALQFHKLDYLAVAYADEGYELRMAGVRLPIMVMNPDIESLIPSLRYELEPEVYGMRILDELLMGLDRNPDIPLPVGIHIKVDSGMHRLGFLPDEIGLLRAKLQADQRVRVRSVFTHLASSEDPTDDAFTHEQVEIYANSCDQLRQGLDYDFLRHVLNSAGISRFPDYQFDMVRLGLGLYGVASIPSDQVFLENVSTLRSVVSQIKWIPEGDTVGYNREWKALRPSRIGIIPVGYADGLDMRLGHGAGQMLIRGLRVPVIGKVCMDMCMVDLTGMDAEEGDEVVIFGEGMGVAEVALRTGTIPYEILTGISSRVKRVYYYD